MDEESRYRRLVQVNPRTVFLENFHGRRLAKVEISLEGSPVLFRFEALGRVAGFMRAPKSTRTVDQ